MAAIGESAAPLPSPVHSSPWHSPVPYLFGGLAAMLGLIAFALLILACSYLKLSGNFENQDGEGEGDLEVGGGEKAEPPSPAMEEKFLVIMAGQVNPTFLATPVSSRASSFGSESSCRCGDSTTPSKGNCGTVKDMVRIKESGGQTGIIGAPGTRAADNVQ